MDLSEESQAIDALKQIITTNNAGTKEDYFKLLVLDLSKLLQVDYVLIGKLAKENDSVTTIAVTGENKLIDNFSYLLKGTPCQNVTQQGCCIYPDDVAKLFPDDILLEEMGIRGYLGVPITNSHSDVIGVLVALSKIPLIKTSYIENVMEAFSVKASVEFERIKQNTIIESVKKRLDQKVSKMEMQHCLMSELSSSVDIQEGDLWSFSKKLTKLVSQKLRISRVSVWILNSRFTHDRSSCVYDRDKDEYSEGDEKLKRLFEKEFDNFVTLPYLDSNELTDVSLLTPYLSEYLKENNITSMLDCPIRSGDKILGILSFEKTHDNGQWMSEEKAFIVQLSNLLTLTIANRQKSITHRELVESRDLLSKVQNIAKFGTFEIDVIKKQFIWSDALRRLLDLSCNGAPMVDDLNHGFSILNVIDPKDRRRIESAIVKCIDNGEAFNEEFTAILLEEKKHLLKFEGMAVIEGEGIGKVIGFIQDITDLVKAKDEADSKQKRIENFVEQSPLGIIEWGLDFVIKGWNPEAERIFGWSKNEMVGTMPTCLLPEEVLPEIEKLWEELVKGSGGEYSVNANNTKDQGQIFCEWRNTPLLDSDQNIVGVLSFVQDVTERKSVEENIKRSENKFSTIFETSPDAISISEVETGLIIEVNPGYCKISGWDHEDIIGRTSLDINIWMSVEERTEFMHMIKREKTVDGMQMNFRRKDGRIVIGMLSGRIVTLNNKPHLLAYFHDISDRIQSENELVEANKRFETLTMELDERVKARTRELTKSVSLFQKREADFSLLSRMQDLLLSCQTRQETFDILKNTAMALFPVANGGLALYQEKEKLFTTVLKFGKTNKLSNEFSIDDCWGLRQGRMHEMHSPDRDPVCNHFKTQSMDTNYMCLPLMVQGRTFGMLWLDSNDKKVGFTQTDKQLIVSMADTIKLALSNLDLRSALHNQAVRDPLTGLYNRRFLQESLETIQARYERTGEPYSVALIDIDYFKKLNDTKGHDAGDEVLVELSKILQASMEDNDVPYRYGGEEFVIVMPSVDAKVAYQRLENLRNRWRNHRVIFNGVDLGQITMSVGIATAPTHGDSPGLLITSADKALYFAKENGRDQVQTFSYRPERPV